MSDSKEVTTGDSESFCTVKGMLYIDRGVTLFLNVLKLSNQLIHIHSWFKTVQPVPVSAGLVLALGSPWQAGSVCLLSPDMSWHRRILELRTLGRTPKCRILMDRAGVSHCVVHLFYSSAI